MFQDEIRVNHCNGNFQIPPNNNTRQKLTIFTDYNKYNLEHSQLLSTLENVTNF